MGKVEFTPEALQTLWDCVHRAESVSVMARAVGEPHYAMDAWRSLARSLVAAIGLAAGADGRITRDGDLSLYVEGALHGGMIGHVDRSERATGLLADVGLRLDADSPFRPIEWSVHT